VPQRETAALLSAIEDFASAYGRDSQFAGVIKDAKSLAASIRSVSGSAADTTDTPGRRAASRARSSTGGQPPIEAARAMMGAGPARRGHGR
jgi:hypothetical protein